MADAEHYHFVEVNWLSTESVRSTFPSIDRGRESPVTTAAFTAPQVRGLDNRKRLPAYRIEQTADGYRLSISDVRFPKRAGSGLGAEGLERDRDFRVISR